jgi:Uma2 family endonuclease
MTTIDSPAMSVQLPARPLTLDDVAVLAAADDVHRYELQEGNLVVMPPANVEQYSIIMRMGGWFLAAGFSADRVLPTPGLRIAGRSAGRSPDLMILSRAVDGSTVWVDPTDVLLVVEVVSPGSEDLDRRIKPAEYARARVPHFWRVDRDGGAVTVHMFRLGTDERGDPAYFGHRAELLDDLLAGQPPKLA